MIWLHLKIPHNKIFSQKNLPKINLKILSQKLKNNNNSSNSNSNNNNNSHNNNNKKLFKKILIN